MPFLEMAEASRRGHLLEALSRVISKHAVRHHRLEDGVPRAHVKIRIAVRIEVSIVGAHHVLDPVEAHGCSHIRKRSVSVIAVQARNLSGMRLAEVFGGHVLDACEVGGRIQVQPTVIVEVPEPHGKAHLRLEYTRLGGNVSKRPRAGSGHTVVCEQDVRLPHARDVQIRVPVIVIVSPNNPFRAPYHVRTHRRRDIGEGAVPVVVKQLVRIATSPR